MQKIIIASGPVIVENNQVLLNQHGDTDFWKFCGGRTQNNESLIETAERRAKEEMGVTIEIIDFTPFITHTFKETTDGKIDVILVHFLARRIDEINPGIEIREWSWHAINNLPINLAPNIRPALANFGFLE